MYLNIYSNTNLYNKSNTSFEVLKNQPLLEGIQKYDDISKLRDEVQSAIKEYQNKIREVVKEIESWGWNDPVSKIYHEVLSDRILDDSNIDYDKISEEFKRRSDLNIPPGFEDKSKKQNQAGDLIIWKEILNFAKDKRKHVIFVSGDNKPDWWHKSNKESLYPRFELVDEFREVTEIKQSEGVSWVGGRSFHIISLSKLLEIFGTDENVVDSVKSSEQILQSDIVRSFDSPKKEDCKYRRYLKIPEDHEINISGKGSKVKGGYDTDIYLITELNQDGKVENIYELYDSMKTSPPFNTEIYAKKL